MGTNDLFTVKQLADLAGVSVRTLHHYDAIGLLKPSTVDDNGYRRYDREALLRLQQIRYYRELDLELKAIRDIIDAPGFDVMTALQDHRQELLRRGRRLRRLVRTIDKTLLHLKGVATMSHRELFRGFTEQDEKVYAAEAGERWGAETVDACYRKWDAYGKEKQQAIIEEMGENARALCATMPHGPGSPRAQTAVATWAKHLEYFYQPTPGILRGLGQMYVEDERFAANYRPLHPDLPEFFRDAINIYVDSLENSAP